MKVADRRFIAENLLLALNILILMLLIFSNRIVLPVWLQATGRLHPVVLHFPIVLLLIAYGFYFFSSNNLPAEYPDRKKARDAFLLTGTLLAGITVIMGIFLSEEEGYEEGTLQWHKWGGSMVFFFSSLLFLIKDARWIKNFSARILAIIATIILLIAGHNGGRLTHGEGFVTAPLFSKDRQPVAFEDAEIFTHVILPVLEAKCIGCHNPLKLKGGLSLTDSALITKGGKTGPLFVAGNTEISLLLKRIHLPEADKKHMPPAGKPQLTFEEIELIKWWIRDSVPFSGRIADRSVSDSLRIFAAASLPTPEGEKMYSFPAADESLVKKLNNDFRSVIPLSINAAPLNVNIYNYPGWTAASIKELMPVKEQIISMELNRVPLKNEDLKLIAEFINLERLNLNFTAIDGNGLKNLSPLIKLGFLSVSGTSMNPAAINQFISVMPALKKIAIWNSALSKSEMDKLAKVHPDISFELPPSDSLQMMLQLNKVQIKNSSSVFRNDIDVDLRHPIRGTEIRYSLGDKEPDSISSPVYTGNLRLDSASVIKVRAYKAGWLKSDITEFRIYKSRYRPDSVKILKAVHERFPALGAETFFNGQLGGNSQFGDKWIGFSAFPMELLLYMRKTDSVRSVAVNYLFNPPANIFPPAEIEVWAGNDENELHLIKRIKLKSPAKTDTFRIATFECSFPALAYKYLKVVAKPGLLPAWNKNKGKPSLLLVDEILLN